jgi:uncharacterized repeat protein (TIGR03803 family)
MCKLGLWKTIGLVGVFCALAVIGSPAQTFKTLLSFIGTDGASSPGSLVQGLDGNFYGTTISGGANSCDVGGFSYGCGTVFKITPGGTLTTLHSFDGTDGSIPGAGLVLATDGNFYGTTQWGGGANPCFYGVNTGCGTVFKITPGGKLTTLHSFRGADGSTPRAELVQATDGNFYGTTFGGGANGNAICTIQDVVGCGTVFRITPGGTLTTLYSFCSKTNCIDGAVPDGALVQVTDGNFYGTTPEGGANGYGMVYKITPGGTLTTLHSFDGKDGSGPVGGLVQATNGNFYGTTNGYFGSVFKLTPGGTLSTLYSFCAQRACDDGFQPGALFHGTDGNFYGTTCCAGANGYGTVFKITPGGALTTLHSFDGTDGASPTYGDGALLQGTDGTFYGTTTAGGASNTCTGGCGTVFSLAVGLGRFVKTLPTSGEVGAAVIILGTDLTGSTSVTFDGTAAAFTVVSSSEISTTVPSGAATGEVRVTTPQGTLICNVDFRVTPSVISVTPAAPTGPNVTFALAYSAAPGEAYTDLEWARVLFNGPPGVNVCRVDYYQPCEEFYLESDTGTWLGPLTPGSTESLSNSQCTVNGRGTTVVGSGSTLTLNLSLTAASGFVGEKNIDMWVNDMQGNASGWQTEGTWTPAPATAPATARRSPSR